MIGNEDLRGLIAEENGSAETALSAAVIRGEEPAIACAVGLADLQQRIPATVETIYRIASLTKPITATLMMRLVQRGVISLDDEIARFMPELRGLPAPSESKAITFRALASHAA